MSTHGSPGIRPIGYGDQKFPLARTKILHAPVPTIPASGFVSNELQFGSLFAPVGTVQGPQGRNMRRERDYRDLASVSPRYGTSADGGEFGAGMPQCRRRQRIPSRGRDNRRLQPDVFPHGRIKPPRVRINQYCPREDIPRKEGSDYRRVAIAARTHRRKRLTNCTEGRTQACNQSNLLFGCAE